MKKTNALRILDGAKIAYTLKTYDEDTEVDGVAIAEAVGSPVEATFKTLIASSKKGFGCFVIPVKSHLDLKKAGAVLGEKSVKLIDEKELFPLTGYHRGGCSPVGLKKAMPIAIDESATSCSEIYLSAGRKGMQMCLSLEDFLDLTKATVAPITRHEV